MAAMRLAARLLLIGGILAALLAGCGVTMTASPDAVMRTGQADERIRLTIWHNWVGQDGKAIAMREILNQFRANRPDVLLVDEGMATDAFRTRLRTVAAADEIPDLFVMFPYTMTRELATANLIQPVDDFLERYPGWKEGFLPGTLDGYTIDGQIYAVPMNLAPTSLIYYNQAIFDQYGVKVPTTWNEWLDAIRIFNEHGVIPIALGNKANWVVQSTIFSTLADRVTGSEWFYKAVAQDGARFTDPVFIDALRLLQQLNEAKPFQDNYRSLDENQMAQLYFEGKAASFINGGWATSNIVKNAPKDVLDHTHITILPPIEGGQGMPNAISGVVGTGLGVSSRLEGARREAALELFYALSGPSGQQATLESSTLISFRMEPDKEKAHPLFLELHELVQRTPLGPVYDVHLSPEATVVINEGLQELLLGGDPYAIAARLQETQAAAVARGAP